MQERARREGDMAQSQPLVRTQPGQQQGSAEAQILLPRRSKSTGGVAAVLFSAGYTHTPWASHERPMSSSEVLNAHRTARSDEMPGFPP